MNTFFLLQFLGLFLAILGMAGLIRTRHFIKLVDEIEHSTFDVFVLSALRVMVGLIFVLDHGIWGSTVEIIVSSFGWLILLVGVVGLLFPQWIMQAVPAFSKHPMRMRARMMIAFVVGVALALCGFGFLTL